MATIAQVKNILEKAKKGQYVSLLCDENSDNFNAMVVQLGTDKVQSVKAEDWEEGWPSDPTPVSGPLCFTAEQAGSTIRLITAAGEQPAIATFYPDINLQYSTDGTTWTEIDFTQVMSPITLTNVGDKVYFKAVTENKVDEWTSYAYNNPPIMFSMTGKIAASGNVQYLLTSDGSKTDLYAYCYYMLF